MVKLPKISTSQLFTLLIISRMFSIFTYKPTSYNLSAAAAALAVFISVIINILIFLPVLSLLKRYKDRNFSDIAYMNMGSFARVYSVLVIAVCLFLCVECVTQFELFMTSTIYTNASPLFFVIPIIIVAVYICRLSIETLARMSGFIFISLILTLVAIVIAVAPQINTVWVQRASDNETREFLRFTLENVTTTTEIIPFMILASYAKGGFRKGAVSFCVTVGVFFELISFLTFSVLGNYKETIMFPFYTVAAMVESTLIERFNAAYTVLWVFMSVIRLCVYMLAAAKEIRNLRNFKNDTIPLIICAVFVTFVSVFAIQSISYVNILYYIIFTGIPLVVIALIFPFVLLVLSKKKGERNSD